MSFTTAGTATVSLDGRQQYQALFSRVYGITITGANPASIAAGAEDTQSWTVPGLALGDVVLGASFSYSQGGVSDVFFTVSAANTLVCRISNLDGSTALDFGSGLTIKVLVGRPAW